MALAAARIHDYPPLLVAGAVGCLGGLIMVACYRLFVPNANHGRTIRIQHASDEDEDDGIDCDGDSDETTEDLPRPRRRSCEQKRGPQRVGRVAPSSAKGAGEDQEELMLMDDPESREHPGVRTMASVSGRYGKASPPHTPLGERPPRRPSRVRCTDAERTQDESMLGAAAQETDETQMCNQVDSKHARELLSILARGSIVD